VQRIATQGLSAIFSQMAEFATGLVDTVIGGIRDWVARSVVGAAITRLITMFNPAGAIIQAIIAAYNTVKFFIERAQQLAALTNSVFDSIGAIAGGAVGAAVTRVEQSLARALPVALGFLARLIGLGDIAAPVRNLIERARGVLDRAMDRVVEWLAGMGRRLRGGTAQTTTSAVGDRAQARRMTADAVNRLLSTGVTHAALRRELATLKSRYGWSSLELVNDAAAGSFAVTGRMSPPVDVATGVVALRIIESGVSVKVPPPQRGFAGEGNRYAYAVRKGYLPLLADERFGTGGWEINDTWSPRRGSASRLDRVRIKPEQGIRKGGFPGEEKIPDYRAEVFAPDQATGRRPEAPTTVHSIEVTCVTAFEDKSPVGGVHKVEQFVHTMNMLKNRYPVSRIVVTFIAPGEPSPKTLKFMTDTVIGMELQDRVTLEWRIVAAAP
jgi:hypothetical protein